MLDSIINEAKRNVGGLKSSEETKKSKSEFADSWGDDPPKKEQKEDDEKQIADEETSVYVPAESDPKELITRDKNEIFKEFLSLINTEDMPLSDAEKEKLNAELDIINKSYVGIVKRCEHSTCNHTNICPFSAIGRYPIGKLCPLESCIAKHSAIEYFKHLAEELGSANFNIIEINTVYSLVAIEVEEFRARNFLNNQGIVTDFAAFAVRRTGEIIYNKSENPVYSIMEKVSRRKHRLLQRLLLTPESKAKYRVDSGKGRGNKTKEILMRAEKKIRQLKENEMNAPDTES